MARSKFQTLTEQMFYILLCLSRECCGTDIIDRVPEMTNGRIQVGPGTLYNLLEQFLDSKMIEETASQGRKRRYILTSKGREALEKERDRLLMQLEDFRRVFGEEDSNA